MKVAWCALALSAFVAGCGPHRASRTPASPDAFRDEFEDGVQTGLASYYADSLAGRATASGEPYDPMALTAAHRTLPLGSVVQVHRDGFDPVTVRVNDRGPYASERRVIDLSRRAAELLGMMQVGVTAVTLRILSLPPRGAKRQRASH